jgi:hypothetical protein
MLLPAINAFGREGAHCVALVYVKERYAEQRGTAARLCGVFPLERMARYRALLPLRHWRLWNHKHCFLGTPLVRAGDAHGCLAAFLDWLATDSPAAMLDWGLIAADGPFYKVFHEVLTATRRRCFVKERFARALLRRGPDAQAFLCAALPTAARKEFRRLERRLSEAGTLEYRTLRCAADAGAWIDDFLELELRGWKGRNGSALGSNAANEQFFLRAATEAGRRGRLMMLRLDVAGRPVAMKCNLLTQDAAFAFKIAYDEAYARFSPGVLLELENIRSFHAETELQWMDSCADPDHFMANRLWPDRRTLVMLMTSSGSAAGELMVSSLPALRGIYRRLRKPFQPQQER